MISWLDTLEDVDSRPIKAVYGDHLPTLSNVEITELELDGRGLDLILHLDLAEFPVVPPRKWSTKRANTVAIELRLLDLGKVSISGVPTRNPAIILISPYNDGVRAILREESFAIDAEAHFVSLGSMVAYHNSNRSQSEPL